MKPLIYWKSILFLLILQETTLYGQNPVNKSKLYQLSVRDIQEISVASGVKESLQDIPVSAIIITAKDIEQRGYTAMVEILYDLPGFDVIHVSSEGGISNAYQRGYRTPFTQRTLFMINGKIDKHLWVQSAHLSFQYPVTNIKRVEVLYGPSSVIYGANTFLGIINVVTKDGKSIHTLNQSIAQIQTGSFDTYAMDITTEGRIKKNIFYSISAKTHISQEEDLSKRGGFISNDAFGNRDVWGKILDLESVYTKDQFGSYNNTTTNYGIFSRVFLKNMELGFLHWKTKEGTGTRYAGDRVQNGSGWQDNSTQYYIEHKKSFKNIQANTLVTYRRNRFWGDFAEASPDTQNPRYSYIVYSKWNSINWSLLFKEDVSIRLNRYWQLTGGLKYQIKRLTKSYDVPGYWNDVYSSVELPDGKYGLGYGIGYSTDEELLLPPVPQKNMPAENLIYTHDTGAYALGIFDIPARFRINLGLRVDYNSMYGPVLIPRLSFIYKIKTGAIKLLYGEAFQEPAPIQLWGGWSGRIANPNLKPEKVKNTELNLLFSVGKLQHNLSVYHAWYKDVIKEDAENAGQRKILGVEYKLEYSLPNPIPKSEYLKTYFYYTYTSTQSSVTYDHTLEKWIDRWSEQGDIATHKWNFGLNIPIQKNFNLNWRGNYVGRRSLYTRNPLRAQGKTLPDFILWHVYASFRYQKLRLGFKMRNIFNNEVLLPGIHQAGAGDDFTQRSKGFHNSVVPEAGRSFLVTLQYTL